MADETEAPADPEEATPAPKPRFRMVSDLSTPSGRTAGEGTGPAKKSFRMPAGIQREAAATGKTKPAPPESPRPDGEGGLRDAPERPPDPGPATMVAPGLLLLDLASLAVAVTFAVLLFLKLY